MDKQLIKWIICQRYVLCAWLYCYVARADQKHLLNLIYSSYIIQLLLKRHSMTNSVSHSKDLFSFAGVIWVNKNNIYRRKTFDVLFDVNKKSLCFPMRPGANCCTLIQTDAMAGDFHLILDYIFDLFLGKPYCVP